MRPLVGLCVLVGLASACSDEGGGRTAVVPGSIEVSPDRRTLTVATSYPTSIDCGQLPAGLDVEVNDGIALITAMMRSRPGDGDCTLECGWVTQTTTLDEPLPNDVSFEAPQDADPGCWGPDPPLPSP